MRRVTTPTHTFTFPDAVNVGSLSAILINYAQNYQDVLFKTINDLLINAEENTVALTLTQEESAKFSAGKAVVQIRAKTNSGKVLASQIINFMVKPVINEEIL